MKGCFQRASFLELRAACFSHTISFFSQRFFQTLQGGFYSLLIVLYAAPLLRCIERNIFVFPLLCVILKRL
jgi:hypothetical protein